MYTKPPLIINATSPALIVGSVSVTVLAAPGAGLRYRLYGLFTTLDQAVAAATQVACVFVDVTPATGIIRSSMKWDANPGWSEMFNYPGLILAENSALRLDSASTAAGSVVRCGAYYYIDKI